MNRTLLFLLSFILPCLQVSAATQMVTVVTTVYPEGQPVPAERSSSALFTADLSDRSGLIEGCPILVTLSAAPLLGGYTLVVQSGGTYRDTFTISAVLGSAEESVSSTCVEVVAPPLTSKFMTGVEFPLLSLIVPWETNLAALQITFRQDVSIDGAGNGISLAGGSSAVTITTLSIPEPSAWMLALSAGLLTGGRRRRRAFFRRARGYRPKISSGVRRMQVFPR